MRSPLLRFTLICTLTVLAAGISTERAQAQSAIYETRQEQRVRLVNERMMRNSRRTEAQSRFEILNPGAVVGEMPQQVLKPISMPSLRTICASRERFLAIDPHTRQWERLTVRLAELTDHSPIEMIAVLENESVCRMAGPIPPATNEPVTPPNNSNESEGSSSSSSSSVRSSSSSSRPSGQSSRSSAGSSVAESVSSANSSVSLSVGSSSQSSRSTISAAASSQASSMDAAADALFMEHLETLCRIQQRLKAEYDDPEAAIITTADNLSQQWGIAAELIANALRQNDLCSAPQVAWLKSGGDAGSTLSGLALLAAGVLLVACGVLAYMVIRPKSGQA